MASLLLFQFLEMELKSVRIIYDWYLKIRKGWRNPKTHKIKKKGAERGFIN